MKNSLKLFLRHWAIALLPFMIMKLWIDRYILKKYYVIAVTFHDVSQEDERYFARIVSYLGRRFPFITPQQFENYLSGQFQLKDISLLVTFDDGFDSSYSVTQKYLNPLGIKAVFFCCSDFIGMNEAQGRRFVAHNLYCGHRTEQDVHLAELPMSQDQAKSLHQQGHMIASHTKSHPDLGKNWSQDQLEKEILQGASELSSYDSSANKWFAFPFGGIQYINQNSLQFIQEHFKFCFSGIRGIVQKNVHPMAIPRQSITIQDPYLLQLALFYGATNWIHQKKIRKIQAFAENRQC